MARRISLDSALVIEELKKYIAENYNGEHIVSGKPVPQWLLNYRNQQPRHRASGYSTIRTNKTYIKQYALAVFSFFIALFAFVLKPLLFYFTPGMNFFQSIMQV